VRTPLAAPLQGRRILVTRPRAQAAQLTQLLEAHGAETVALPTIRIEPPEDWAPLDGAIRSLEGFRCLIFTSVNGVAGFRERLRQVGGSAPGVAGQIVVAIGPATAEALRQEGFRADVVPEEFTAEGVVEALRARLGPGDAVLLVRAAEARDVLPRELAASGARVTIAPAYRTALTRDGWERALALLEARQIDAVTFTSSSTVRGFAAVVAPDDPGRLLRDVVVAAIGPITAATAAEHGLRVSVMPNEYTVPALAEAIAGYFATSPPAALRS
jgi:uroporphyrinogen III methyltransferase / synthase